MNQLLLLCMFSSMIAGCAATDEPSSSAHRSETRTLLAERLHLFSGPEATAGTVYVRETFSPDQLRVMHREVDTLEDEVNRRLLDGDHSAAWIAAYFRIESSLPYLRNGLLAERSFYGWEGPDYTQEQAWLQDQQYPRQMGYITAIEAITGKPIDQAIVLDKTERENLIKEASIDDIDWRTNALSYERTMCAKWMLQKLGIERDIGASSVH